MAARARGSHELAKLFFVAPPQIALKRQLNPSLPTLNKAQCVCFAFPSLKEQRQQRRDAARRLDRSTGGMAGSSILLFLGLQFWSYKRLAWASNGLVSARCVESNEKGANHAPSLLTLPPGSLSRLRSRPNERRHGRQRDQELFFLFRPEKKIRRPHQTHTAPASDSKRGGGHRPV